MKTISTIMAVAVVALTMTSCGDSNSTEAKKAQLEKLKVQQIELADQIKALEQEIASSGDTTKSNMRMKDVAVTKIEPATFRHSIDVQGRVEGDEDITASAKMAGSITKINVQAGSHVSAGQIMAEIESGPMRAQLADLKTSYELVKELFNKQKNLWEQKVGTEIQYLQAKNNKESMEQKIKTLQETLDMYLIKAPFSGTVDEVMIKFGQTVGPGSPAIRLVNMGDLKVRADLAESYSAKVKAGDPVNLSFPDIGKTTTSKVAYNGKAIDPMTRTFTVDINLPAGDDYRPNMIAEVSIVDYIKNAAIVVPVNTIQNLDGKNYVFIAVTEKGNWVARKREVQVGQTYNGAAEILAGLQPGDLVITTGYTNLNEGEIVKF